MNDYEYIDDPTWLIDPLYSEYGTVSGSRNHVEPSITYDSPLTSLTFNDIAKEGFKNMKIIKDKAYIVVACEDAEDLEQNRILKCISIMKSMLAREFVPLQVYNIECKMTPAVKKNIIDAYKKLEMYGKKVPFIARFDEYGRQLPDEVKIDTLKGVNIKIVDPDIYGHSYLELKGIYPDLF